MTRPKVKLKHPETGDVIECAVGGRFVPLQFWLDKGWKEVKPAKAAPKKKDAKE